MKEHIYNTIEDLLSDFFYYDRKEDEKLRIWDIEQAVLVWLITEKEIQDKFIEIIHKNLWNT